LSKSINTAILRRSDPFKQAGPPRGYTLEENSTLFGELFPEEIVESGARIQWSAVYSPTGIMSFPLYRSPWHKKVALIAYVLLCDAFWNGLSTLKLRAGIEIAAILTTS
jgi:hypothetical protein